MDGRIIPLVYTLFLPVVSSIKLLKVHTALLGRSLMKKLNSVDSSYVPLILAVQTVLSPPYCPLMQPILYQIVFEGVT